MGKMQTTTKGVTHATISAKITRADGTEEDLGVISTTDADAERILAAIESVDGYAESREAGELTAEAVAEIHAQRSAENQAESERAAAADAAAYQARQARLPEQEG